MGLGAHQGACVINQAVEIDNHPLHAVADMCRLALKRLGAHHGACVIMWCRETEKEATGVMMMMRGYTMESLGGWGERGVGLCAWQHKDYA